MILCNYRGVMSPHHPWSDRLSERFLEISLDQAFGRIVTEYRRSQCMSMRYFSVLAVGDSGFIGCRFNRGCSARLDTVDRAIGFMGEPVFRPFLLGELEAYLAITGIQAYVLGERGVGNPSFVCRFRSGRSPLLRTLDKARRWMHVNSTAAERLEIRTAALKNAGGDAGVRWAHDAGPSVSDCPKRPEEPAEAPVQGSCARPKPECSTEVDDRPGTTTGRNGNGGALTNTRDAAARLGLAPSTLARYRVSGGGPVYLRLGGAVRYRYDDLKAWAAGRRRFPRRSGVQHAS